MDALPHDGDEDNVDKEDDGGQDGRYETHDKCEQGGKPRSPVRASSEHEEGN